MCLLTYFPAGVMPDTDALALGAENNPDGFGYAIVDKQGERLIVNRAMWSDDLITEFDKVRRQYPDGPALFHSRIGTGGTVNLFNCHPFTVGKGDSEDPLTVVAHNGIMPQEVWPRKGDDRCDTHIFAQSHLPRRNLDSTRSRNRLGKWLGTDKLVVLTVNPRYRHHVYLINEHHGVWDTETGIWYSNNSYERMPRRYQYSTMGTGKWRYHNGAWVRYDWYGDGGRGHDEDNWLTFACWSPRKRDHLHYVIEMHEQCDDCQIISLGEESYDGLRGRSVTNWTPYTEELRPVIDAARHANRLGDWSKALALLVEKKEEAARELAGFAATYPDKITTIGPPAVLHTRSDNECILCKARGTISEPTNTCTACLTCQDCGGVTDASQLTSTNPEVEYACLCYTPDRATAAAVADELDEATLKEAARALFLDGIGEQLSGQDNDKVTNRDRER